MTVSKENFRKAMLFGLMVRRVYKAGKESKLYLFDCPLCGGDVMAIKTKSSMWVNVSIAGCIHKNRTRGTDTLQIKRKGFRPLHTYK